MLKITKTLFAEEDLINIWVYTLQEWGEVQADHYLDNLEEIFKQISETPMMARERQEYNPPVRIHPHEHHLIIYRASDTEVEIIRVLHENMSVDSHLSL